MILEKDLERKFVNAIKKIGGLTYKFVSPGNAGVPDRIVIYKGNVVFVELKRPGEEPRPLQKAVFDQMSDNGAYICIIDSEEDIKVFVEQYENTNI